MADEVEKLAPEGRVNLYAPENVVAYLRSIESNSIAGMQFRRAADEIERLRKLVREMERDHREDMRTAVAEERRSIETGEPYGTY